MSDIENIVPSSLNNASTKEKKAFFQVLLCLSGIDGQTDEDEFNYIIDAAQRHGINNLDDLTNFSDEKEVLKNVKVIKNRDLALELIKEMCTLSHLDSILSDEETLFIGQIGLALGIEMDKIEQISNWVIDRIIWLEQAKIIFERD
ncbi:MAG: hypothetical protein J6N49_04085 [Alphaproteobacteria bacterium]|nr:hypothetical protein [Alphaproteobacteria bacterium]